MRKTCLLIGLLAATAVAGTPTPRDIAAQEVAAAERAFAQMSVEQGVRASFIANFAESGVNFTPHPVKTKADLSAQPAPAQKPPFTLDWHPVRTDAAQSGDMGYNTGPYTVTDNSPQKRPTRYGQFFSIWKKQTDGTWKVVLDMGGPTAAPEGDEQPRVVPVSRFKLKGTFDVDREVLGLKQAENDFSSAAGDALAAGYAKFLDGDAWLIRLGRLPLRTSPAVNKYISEAQAKGKTSWHPLFADVARSADLGYTYGSYSIDAAGGPVEKGYYTHVWKRNAKGEWKVVLDVTNPLPPEEKK